MKRFLTLFISLLLILSCVNFIGCKKQNKIYKVYLGMSYVLQQDNTLAVYQLTDKKAKKIVIPASIDSKKVTYISSNAFKGAENMQRIIIPSSVESIGESAFENCKKLTTVEINYVLNGTDIIGVKTINKNAFKYSNITSIDLNGVNTIKNYAFYGCENLINISNLKQLKNVGDYAFANCTKLLDVNFEYRGSVLGDYVFKNCISLKTANINQGAYGFGCFMGCNSLQNLSLPTLKNNNQTYLGYCFGASSYELNSSYIPNSLTNLTIINGEGISENTFYNCQFLKEITIVINYNLVNAFSGCNLLQTLNISSLYVEIEDSGYYLKLYELFGETISSVPTTLTNITISKDTYIYQDTFNGCSNLINVNAPNVNKIGKNAFLGCNSLNSIVVESANWFITQENFINGTQTNFTIDSLTTNYANYNWYITL